MDVKEAIGLRSSVRRYSVKSVPDDAIRELLDAARCAPSGCNAQPWRFCVVRSAETVEALKRRKAFPQDFVYKAPAVIVCCGDPDAYTGRYGGENQVEDGSVPEDAEARKTMFRMVEGKNALRALRDVSIASAFLVLRATELGLATSYVGLIDEAALHKALAIPERLIIPFVITVGYAEQLPSNSSGRGGSVPRTPRKGLEDILIRDAKSG
jgi:nitroreductase